MLNRLSKSFYCLLLTAYCLLLAAGCSNDKSKQQPSGFPPAPVILALAGKQAVPLQVRAIGNVEASSTVSIKARVSGELIQVNFREGQDINKGDLIFKIDPQPYETALKAAQANLTRSAVLAKKADDDAVRYKELFREQLVSKEDYDRVIANSEALKAALKADEAAMENARLQLEYSTIYAPVSGRTGDLLVDAGNLIKANDEKPMVVINRVQPVYVNFSVPESNLFELKKYMSSGKLKVDAFISVDDKNPEEGLLFFIDNTVDTATGTIKLKASFSNKDKRLWPGQFVNLNMTLAVQQDVIVVPSQAVQTGQQGQYVFVVKEDKAELRPVDPGITYENMTVIEKGLTAGEQVVIDGQIRLFPGAKVEIKNQ